MSKDPNEKITVRICCEETVHYETEVEMTRAEFEKWDAALDDDRFEASEQIMGRFIDRPDDWLNDSAHDVDTFEIVGEDEPETDEDAE